MSRSASLPGHPNVDDWLAFRADGRLAVRSGKVDIGQRVSAAIRLVAAEELDLDPARVEVVERETGLVPNEGYTSGSRSIQDSAQAVRLGAATARRHLAALAAERLGVAAEALEVSNGTLRAPGTNRTTTWWELAGAETLGIPVDPDAMVKGPDAHRLLGRVHEAPELRGLVDGSTKFVHDMVLPGMLHARVVRPPHYHARLEALAHDLEARLQVGAHLVRDGSFLAVAHADEWVATRLAARVAAGARWSDEPGLDSSDVFERLAQNPRTSLPVIDGAAVDAALGPAPGPPQDASVTLAARFERAYQMHAAIGPSAALAHLEGGRLTVWSHSQGIYPLRASLAEALDMDLEAVRVIHARGSGCYGHNGADDAALDAALVACALPGRPVLLKWSRADEHGFEPYGSAMRVEIEASLDADGRIATWSHEAWSDTHVTRPQPGIEGHGAARLLASRHRAEPLTPPPARPSLGFHSGLHRNQDPIYATGARRVVKHLVHDLPLRTSSLRALGALVHGMAIESFMDELAEAAGADPLAFRLDHLADPRARAVLERTVEALAGGDTDGEAGRGFGFARYKNEKAYAAVGVELVVDDTAAVRLRRAVIVADAGEIIDRAGLTAQLEGGFLQAASMTLHEAVGYDAHGITTRDWESYPILRFDEVPDVRTILIERPGDPFLGAGEAAMGPTAGAIANAIYAAVGLRLRRLPFTPDAIRSAALA